MLAQSNLFSSIPFLEVDAMKSFTLVSLLLATLISTCTARNIDVDSNWFQGSSWSDAESIRQIKTAGNGKNGSNQTLEAIDAALASVRNCIRMKVDASLMDDLDRLNVSTRRAFFSKYCPQIRSIVLCFELPMTQLSECVDFNIFQLRSFNATLEVLDLLCKNDGEILLQEGDSVDVCIRNYYNYTKECTMATHGKILHSTNTTVVLKYDEAQCGKLAKLRDCMDKKLNECRSAKLIDLHDVYWHALLKNSPCENLMAKTFDRKAGSIRNEIILISCFVCLALAFSNLMIYINCKYRKTSKSNN